MSINYEKQDEELLALSYAMKILKAWFSEVPEIEWVLYIDGIPEPIRTLIQKQIDYREVQSRIYHISLATELTIPAIRKLMKTKTLTELEEFQKIWDKIIIKDRKYFMKPRDEWDEMQEPIK